MGFKKIFIILFFIALIGFLIYVFVYYEIPTQEKVEKTSELTISAMDDENNRNIKTGFLIKGIDTSYLLKGNTSQVSHIKKSLPYNHTFRVSTVNIGEQRYYQESEVISTAVENQVYRVDFNLKKPGKFYLKQKGDFNEDGKISIEVSSLGYIKNYTYCLDWGLHIVDVIPEINHTKTKRINPEAFECYTSNISLENSKQLIPLNYSYWVTLNSDDYLRFSVYDNEYPKVNATLLIEP